MTRAALWLTAVLVFAWIIAIPAAVRGWTTSELLRTIAVLVDIPLAVWLAGLGWTAFRRGRLTRR
jgi:hypothetical protein